MKIIEPKVELWQQGDNAKAHVARCARVCYGRETGNDEATIKRLINDNHCKYVKNKHIGNCPDCVFNKYLCYGLLCNIVVLKVVKDEEMRNNK